MCRCSSLAEFVQEIFWRGYFYFGINIDWRNALWVPLNYRYKDYLADGLDEDQVVSDLVSAVVSEDVAREFVDKAYVNVQRVINHQGHL